MSKDFNYNYLLKTFGKEDNIENVFKENDTCRFKVKNLSAVDISSLNDIDFIDNITISDQVITLFFESDVKWDFEELKTQLYELKNPKPKHPFGRVVDVVIKTITGSINPVVPLLAGAGMGKVLLIILTLLHVLDDKDTTYIVLKLAFDSPFYFLPGLVGFSAGKVFKANPYISAFLGLILVNPVYVGMVKAAHPITFLGLSLPLHNYSAQIIPTILMIWIYSYIERFFDKIVPKSIRLFIAPLLSILVMTPASLLIIAPIGDTVGGFIANTVLWSSDHFGFMALAVLAAVYPWLVTMGLHKALSPVSIMLVAQQGYDPVVRCIALCSNIAQASASLAVAIKAKNKNLKSVAMSGAITAFLGGYTETALYGVNLKLRKPMFACMIGAAFAGAYAGLVGLKAYAYVTPAILSLPMWIGSKGNYLVHAIITLLISTIITFIVTLIIGFDESDYEETPKV